MTDTENTYLNDLAAYLATNYAHISFDRKFDNYDAILDTAGLTLDTKRRNILIIGSGASRNTHHRFLTAKDAINKIEFNLGFNQRFKGNGSEYEKLLYDSRVRKLTYGNFSFDNRPTDFETRLNLLLYYYDIKTLRDQIQNLYAYRTHPSTLYEIVAHMFKNRFIDIVINFNFDELLDQAIEEEISTGMIHKIVFDGDCVENYKDLLVDERLKVPIYIKPHGTVSHRSSLRFTKEHYLDMPFFIERLLQDLFTVHVVPGEGSRQTQDFHSLNLIVVGFEFESIEFNRLIQRALKSNYSNHQDKATIFFFDFVPPDNLLSIEALNERIEQKFEKTIAFESDMVSEKKIIRPYEIKRISVNPKYSLNEAFSDLYRLIETRFKGPDAIQGNEGRQTRTYTPRGLARHYLLVECFKHEINQEDIDWFKGEEYYLQRTVLEIVIACFKNKGKIQMKEHLGRDKKDRIGIYYDYYFKSPGKSRPVYTPDEICCAMAMKNNVFSLVRIIHSVVTPEATDKEIWDELTKWVTLLDSPSTGPGPLREAVRKVGQRLKKDYQSAIGRLEMIYKSDVIDVRPNFDDGELYVFDNYSSSNVLSTDLAFTYRFYEPFFNEMHQKNWKILLTVAERGKYLMDELQSFRNIEHKRIDLIVSDENYSEEWQHSAKRHLLLGGKYHLLPYYTHNQHMAIFVDIVGGRLLVQRAIYYYKKGYANSVNPIYFEYDMNEKDKERKNRNQQNFDMLLELFFAYKLKAEKFTNGGQESVYHIPHSASLNLEHCKKVLVESYYASLINGSK